MFLPDRRATAKDNQSGASVDFNSLVRFYNVGKDGALVEQNTHIAK